MAILRDHGYKPWAHLRSASDRTCASANHNCARRRTFPIRKVTLCDDSTAPCCFSRHGHNILLCRLIVRHVRRTRVLLLPPTARRVPLHPGVAQPWVLFGLARAYAAGAYRLPLDNSAVARWNVGLPMPLAAMLTELAARLRERLNQPLATFYPPNVPPDKSEA